MANELIEKVARAIAKSDGNVWGDMGDRMTSAYHAGARAVIPIIRADALEDAAKVAEGEVYHQRYRTWPFWKPFPDGSRGNCSGDSDLVKHCDDIATAIRKMGESE